MMFDVFWYFIILCCVFAILYGGYCGVRFVRRWGSIERRRRLNHEYAVRGGFTAVTPGDLFHARKTWDEVATQFGLVGREWPLWDLRTLRAVREEVIARNAEGDHRTYA